MRARDKCEITSPLLPDTRKTVALIDISLWHSCGSSSTPPHVGDYLTTDCHRDVSDVVHDIVRKITTKQVCAAQADNSTIPVVNNLISNASYSGRINSSYFRLKQTGLFPWRSSAVL
jgi:hypothetical protein